MTLRARVTLAALVVLAAAIAACAFSLTALVHDSLVSNVDEAAEVLANDVEARLAAGSLPSVMPVQGGRDDDDLIIQVVEGEGAVVAATENATGLAPIAVLRQTRHRSRATISGLAIDPEENFRVLSQRAALPSGERVTVYVATELEPVRRTVADVRTAVRVGAPSLLAVTGLLVWYLVGREVRTRNAMLAGLQQAAERQHRFVSDASHELRSPLTSTRSAVEVALADPRPSTLMTAVTDVLAETERMERLVDDLLFLARGDEGRLTAQSGPVDLDDVVWSEASRLRNRSQVPVDTAAVDPVRVRGVRSALERAVRNLLENAERHTRTAVSVTLRSSGGVATLAVSDDGAGVPPEHRERIFDRFTRLDDDRSRNRGGTGLGLAIVREIACAHGGRVTVEDAPGGGARFVMVLPEAET